ncbi:hypothetical protein Afil01_52430 [Actinorhabdospora filicis]|uniref:Uncharacterized protein n=1 Tax=Actinorhabdospora filicis TaxID=1785913 RepID=A0A9W6WCB9_9ACTN|nr:DUF6058 family natural product biosynthesis protein [Actinorhabdospora filicis]GLZ80436.1 hypothetical protein Afil01_52430 [Actinorhabdospora filicis]
MDLKTAVAARFREINGDHPMTEADDAYVSEWFRTLEQVCEGREETPDGLRARMLAGELPLPGYLRSDGAEMVHPDYLALPGLLGEGLRELFVSSVGEDDWDLYLSGQFVCVRSVTPGTMMQKHLLVRRIEAQLERVEPDLVELGRAVGELDALEPPFAPDYDVRRFGRATSRTTLIEGVRAQYGV